VTRQGIVFPLRDSIQRSVAEIRKVSSTQLFCMLKSYTEPCLTQLHYVDLNLEQLHRSFTVMLPTDVDEEIKDWRITSFDHVVVCQQSKLTVLKCDQQGVCTRVLRIQIEEGQMLWLAPDFDIDCSPFIVNSVFKRVVDLNRDGFTGAVQGISG
jgi:hypothetical protein